MFSTLSKTALSITFSLFAVCSQAANVTPSTYTFSQLTDCDNNCYSDISHTKLSDNILGSGDRQANADAKWVGWSLLPYTYANNPNYFNPITSVDIDFTFSAVTRIDTISIGSITNYANELPMFNIYQKDINNDWVFVSSFATSSISNPHVFTQTNLSINSNMVRITASTPNNWVLIDEVSFGQVSAVPEPDIYLLVIVGLGLIGFVANRKNA